MYSEAMKTSLDLNQRFVDSLSDNELNELMMEFDNLHVEDNSWFSNFGSLEMYLTNCYSTLELFAIFDKRPKKSIDLIKDIKKDLLEGPFFVN